MKREAIGVAVFSVIAALGLSQLPKTTPSTDVTPSAPCEWIPGDPHVIGQPSSAAFSRAEAFSITELSEIVPSRGLEFIGVFSPRGVSAASDPSFGSGGLDWLLGTERVFEKGSVLAMGSATSFVEPAETPAGIRSFSSGVHRNNGVVALGRAEQSRWDAESVRALDADVVEVWRGGPFAYATPGLKKDPAAALDVLDALLDRGLRLGVVGGSGTPSRALSDIAGPGEPTTWVCAERPDLPGILQAMRDGRTTLSHETPQLQGALLFLEADPSGVGTFEGQMGDSVSPGTSIRVSVRGAPAARLRIIGSASRVIETATIDALEYQLTFAAPGNSSWLRAELYLDESLVAKNQRTCPRPGELASNPGSRAEHCGGSMPMLAISSPIFVSD